MATIIEHDGNLYLFTFSLPETDWIRDLAQSMGITKEAVLGAAINKGLTYYVGSFLIKDELPEKEIDDNACDDVC